MSVDLCFQIASFLPGPTWLAYLIAPRSRVTQSLLLTTLLVLCGLYVYLIFPLIEGLIPIIAQPELAVIVGALSNPTGVTIAWIHFVIGDLWMGRWIAIDSAAQGMPWWLRAPLLITTLFFGPIGFLSYLVVRLARTRASGIIQQV